MRSYLLFIIVFLSHQTYAGPLTGRILDSASRPIVLAKVELFCGNQQGGSAEADLSGYFAVDLRGADDTIAGRFDDYPHRRSGPSGSLRSTEPPRAHLFCDGREQMPPHFHLNRIEFGGFFFLLH